MTTIETDWTTHAERLAEILWDRGDIRSPEWRAAIAAVPRHVFVPEIYEQDNTARWIRRATAGDWERVYSPRTLITALADRGGYQEPVSSSTNPELMARMLEILDVKDGQRVLEIGTGTGYQAGLLCHRLGEGTVFSVDIDANLVTLARQRLASLGYRPTLAARDGKLGFAEHQPYDHIIATCSVPAVPRSWGEQLAPDTRQPTAATMTAPDGSWATIDLTDRTVTEAGDTPLWEPVEWAYQLWRDADRPGWDRLGLTVGADGRNQFWIDNPDGSFVHPLG